MRTGSATGGQGGIRSRALQPREAPRSGAGRCGRALGPAELKRAIDPLRSFTLQLDEEVEAYERMQRGSFEPVDNLAGLGRLLIAARIFRRISQRELAKMLGVHESQVSRDERNEYRSITVERANRILEVLRVQLTSEMRPVPDEETVHSRAS